MSLKNSDAVDWLPNDLGGVATGAFERVEHPMLPWEKHCHAMADVLDFHKIMSTEEKRHGVEALGELVINKLGYYERWAVVMANILFTKGILTPSELASKMDEVTDRLVPDEHQSP